MKKMFTNIRAQGQVDWLNILGVKLPAKCKNIVSRKTHLMFSGNLVLRSKTGYIRFNFSNFVLQLWKHNRDVQLLIYAKKNRFLRPASPASPLKRSCLVGGRKKKRDIQEFFVENLMYIFYNYLLILKVHILATLSNFVIGKY